MTIARTTGALIGTDETTGVAVNAAATATGDQVDLLGGTDSTGMIDLYLVFTKAAGATGRVRVHFDRNRVSGKQYRVKTWSIDIQRSGQLIYLDRFPVGRYARAVLENLSSGALANAAVLYELEKTT